MHLHNKVLQRNEGNERGYLDYGIDLEQLSSPNILETITSWSAESVDAQRKPE